MPKLKNRKRERFAMEIAAMTPLEQAYVESGFKSSPWSRYNASKLAHHPDVAARIDELRAEYSDRSGIQLEYLQNLLLPLAESNIRDLFETVPSPDGNGTIQRLRPISAMPRRVTAAISRIKLNEDGVVTDVILADKISAGSTLLRSVGGLLDRLKVSDEFEDMSLEELRKFAVEEARKLGIGAAAPGAENSPGQLMKVSECRSR
jgi:hypothetical protein